MKKIQNSELELIQGGKLSPKTKEWLEGFCLGISIGGAITIGVALPIAIGLGLSGIGVLCDL